MRILPPHLIFSHWLGTVFISSQIWFQALDGSSQTSVFQVRWKRSKCVEKQCQQQAAVEGIWVMLWNVCQSKRRTHDTTGLPHPPSLMLRDYLFLRCQIPFLLPSSRHPWSYQSHGKLFLSITWTYKQKQSSSKDTTLSFNFFFALWCEIYILILSIIFYCCFYSSNFFENFKYKTKTNNNGHMPWMD